MDARFAVPRIGVGVFIVNDDNKFVFGKRKGSHGEGTWALPGGHLELHENFEDCARRETLEETGLDIIDIQFLTAVNSPRIDGSKHYITIFMLSRLVDAKAQPQTLEPNKCHGWQWMDWETMVEWAAENEYGTNGGKEALGEDQGKGEHNLFLPMIDLVQQRPDLRPFSGPTRSDTNTNSV